MGTMNVEGCGDWQGAFTKTIDGIEINRLSDNDLYKMLVEFGEDIGPVVASTRYLYEKKLYRILSTDQAEDTPAVPRTNSLSSLNNKSSPMRTEMADAGPRAAPSLPQPSETITESPADTPEPVPGATPITKEEFEESLYQYSFSTPTYDYSQVRPRPALYEQSADRKRIRGLGKEGIDYLNGKGKASGDSGKTKSGGSAVSTVIEILILSFLIVVGYLFYQEMVSFKVDDTSFDDTKHIDSL